MSDEEAIASGAAAPGEAEIDFEAWADLSARMLKLDQEARFDLLEEREIDPTDFIRAEQRWVMALSTSSMSSTGSSSAMKRPPSTSFASVLSRVVLGVARDAANSIASARSKTRNIPSPRLASGTGSISLVMRAIAIRSPSR